MKILVSYRGIPQSPGWATGDFVVKALREMGHEAFPYGNYYMTNESIDGHDLAALRKDRYDLFIQMECGDGDRFYQELVGGVNAMKRVSWWFDCALYPNRWRQESASFSCAYAFTANKQMVGKNTWCHDRFLPYAADELHIRRYQVDSPGKIPFFINSRGERSYKERDFLIIGSDRPERRELYEAVKAACPGAEIDILSGIFREQYIDEIARTCYVINDVAGGGAGLLPMRPFEVIAACSKLITPKDDGCKELGIPCDEYSSKEDLIQLCIKLHGNIRFGSDRAYYQQNQEQFLTKHMYTNRCEEIINAVSNQVF